MGLAMKLQQILSPRRCSRSTGSARPRPHPRLLPGPFATLVLADLGADVVKVEDPGGDWLRGMPPLAGGAPARSTR